MSWVSSLRSALATTASYVSDIGSAAAEKVQTLKREEVTEAVQKAADVGLSFLRSATLSCADGLKALVARPPVEPVEEILDEGEEGWQKVPEPSPKTKTD